MIESLVVTNQLGCGLADHYRFGVLDYHLRPVAHVFYAHPDNSRSPRFTVTIVNRHFTPISLLRCYSTLEIKLRFGTSRNCQFSLSKHKNYYQLFSCLYSIEFLRRISICTSGNHSDEYYSGIVMPSHETR